MNPKEKAEELLKNMQSAEDLYGNYPMCYETAKQCALICCDEILGYMDSDRGYAFWTEVKEELLKM